MKPVYSKIFGVENTKEQMLFFGVLFAIVIGGALVSIDRSITKSVAELVLATPLALILGPVVEVNNQISAKLFEKGFESDWIEYVMDLRLCFLVYVAVLTVPVSAASYALFAEVKKTINRNDLNNVASVMISCSYVYGAYNLFLNSDYGFSTGRFIISNYEADGLLWFVICCVAMTLAPGLFFGTLKN